MSVLQEDIPQDWYATAFDGMSAEMAWTERTESEIRRALTMLRPQGGERILDLACGTGDLTLAFARGLERGLEIEFGARHGRNITPSCGVCSGCN